MAVNALISSHHEEIILLSVFNKKLTLIGPSIELALQVSDFPATVLLRPSVNQLGGHCFTWSHQFASTGRHKQKSVHYASEL